MLRHTADLRTLIYLGFMVAVFAVLWVFGFDSDGTLDAGLCAPLLTLLCLLAVADAVISHNHNHVPIFRSRWANLLVGCVISFFYGFPSFCWIPTHNQNHHALNNRPGDYSITTRPRRRVGLVGALLYPTVTSLTQARLIGPFLGRCRRRNRALFRRALVEYVVFYGVMIALFVIDWRKALLFAVLPQQVSMFFIQHFNYLQHIETDSDSEFAHSRNFTGWFLNLCLFNNGYHTVHHQKPGLHWSLTPRAHAEVADKIPRRLLVGNLATFWLRRFVTDPLLGRAPRHMTLPAALSPDTLRVTEHGTAMLERACRLRGRAPASRSAKAALAKAPT
ncbi:MAG: fatty acid desaturase [Rhodospirillales bacterium]|nr:fatty acid desaturase [Rhodospirillales bacterium]MDH3792245.1 fatty acid desaturase [Rhodospirillales bacterium]MDH3967053.1 fatty acid desaturase [Rhodospirillales bacterium]